MPQGTVAVVFEGVNSKRRGRDAAWWMSSPLLLLQMTLQLGDSE